MSGKITWKTAIKKVLMEASSPLHYSEITNTILKNKYKPTHGATPKKTVYTSLKRMLKKKDANISMIETGIFIYNKTL